MKEEKLIEYFGKNIEEFVPSLEISTIKTEAKIKNNIIDIAIKTKEGDRILVEVKSSGEPSYVFKAISQLKYYQTDEQEYLMVAVPKISEKSKAICKSAGVGYIDLQGGVFIKYKKILVDKTKDRAIPKQFLTVNKRVSKMFLKNSFRVLLALLKNHNEGFSQKELSAKLKISRAYINRILKTLENGIKVENNILVFEGTKNKEINKNLPGVIVIGKFEFVKQSSVKRKKNIKRTKKYRVTNPSKLLDVLAKQYDFFKNKIISLYSFEKSPTKLMNKIAKKSREQKLDYAFTQHAGASQVAPFVRFEDVYLYIREKDIPKWIKSLDLKRTEFGGNVFLIVPQYEWILEETTDINKKKIVNNIILYLDLINYPKRGKEQAEFLREKKLGF